MKTLSNTTTQTKQANLFGWTVTCVLGNFMNILSSYLPEHRDTDNALSNGDSTETI